MHLYFNPKARVMLPRIALHSHELVDLAFCFWINWSQLDNSIFQPTKMSIRSWRWSMFSRKMSTPRIYDLMWMKGSKIGDGIFRHLRFLVCEGKSHLSFLDPLPEQPNKNGLLRLWGKSKCQSCWDEKFRRAIHHRHEHWLMQVRPSNKNSECPF